MTTWANAGLTNAALTGALLGLGMVAPPAGATGGPAEESTDGRRRRPDREHRVVDAAVTGQLPRYTEAYPPVRSGSAGPPVNPTDGFLAGSVTALASATPAGWGATTIGPWGEPTRLTPMPQASPPLADLPEPKRSPEGWSHRSAPEAPAAGGIEGDASDDYRAGAYGVEGLESAAPESAAELFAADLAPADLAPAELAPAELFAADPAAAELFAAEPLAADPAPAEPLAANPAAADPPAAEPLAANPAAAGAQLSGYSGYLPAGYGSSSLGYPESSGYAAPQAEPMGYTTATSLAGYAGPAAPTQVGGYPGLDDDPLGTGSLDRSRLEPALLEPARSEPVAGPFGGPGSRPSMAELAGFTTPSTQLDPDPGSAAALPEPSALPEPGLEPSGLEQPTALSSRPSGLEQCPTEGADQPSAEPAPADPWAGTDPLTGTGPLPVVGTASGEGPALGSLDSSSLFDVLSRRTG